MEDVKTFKSIITFTFNDAGEIGKSFVNLLKKKFNADAQDQSTYGIPNEDITEDTIREVCLEALNENTENYGENDVVKIFKPTSDKQIFIKMIHPFKEQKKSNNLAHNKKVRDNLGLIDKVEHK